MEPSTLVNSAATSSLDLPNQLQTELEARLVKHRFYQHYVNLRSNHSEKNPLSAAIEYHIHARLTTLTLQGQDKINFRSDSHFLVDDKYLLELGDIPQLEDGDQNVTYTFFHLGNMLSGHDQIIHGGLLATLLDELTCVLAFQNFQSKRGVTANLNISYLKPCYVNSYVMVKCILVKKTGRKCIVKGQVFQLDLNADSVDTSVVEAVETKANLLTECECLVIEPRWVKELQKGSNGQ